MHSRRMPTSPSDVATETGSLLAGLGILTTALFPIALPGLLLFVVAPLALVAVAGLALAIPLLLPLWLARILFRSRLHRRRPAGSPGSAAAAAANSRP
jgi:hypothetical protein